MDKALAKLQAVEISFFAQSFANGLILLSSPICFDVLSRLATEKWGNYCTTIIP